MPTPPRPVRPPDPRARYMSVQQVAAHFRVSVTSIYRLIRAGELPAVLVGRSKRVPVAAVVAYEREHLSGPGRAS